MTYDRMTDDSMIYDLWSMSMSMSITWHDMTWLYDWWLIHIQIIRSILVHLGLLSGQWIGNEWSEFECYLNSEWLIVATVWVCFSRKQAVFTSIKLSIVNNTVPSSSGQNLLKGLVNTLSSCLAMVPFPMLWLRNTRQAGQYQQQGHGSWTIVHSSSSGSYSMPDAGVEKIFEDAGQSLTWQRDGWFWSDEMFFW